MRAFAIVFVAVACSLFLALYVAITTWWPQPPRDTPVVATSEAEPTWLGEPEPDMTAARTGATGWTILSPSSKAPQPGRAKTRTCADPYTAATNGLVSDAGRTTVTLELKPKPGQEVVITDVRVRTTGGELPTPEPAYLVHCPGEVARDVVRFQGTLGESLSAGVRAQQVPETGFRQDITVEVTGAQTAVWHLEVDYTLNGTPRTKSINHDTYNRRLVTEPVPAAVAGHWVWCSTEYVAGEHC